MAVSRKTAGSSCAEGASSCCHAAAALECLFANGGVRGVGGVTAGRGGDPSCHSPPRVMKPSWAVGAAVGGGDALVAGGGGVRNGKTGAERVGGKVLRVG